MSVPEYWSEKNVPQISALMVKEVSDYRKQKLAEQVEQGLFKDGSSSPTEKLTPASYFVVSPNKPFNKTAQVASSGGGFRGAGDTVYQTPEVYSPLWLNSNLSLPRDRVTTNSWNRAFYALNPIVRNAIDLHSTYPISKLSIKCANKEAEDFFNQMIEETQLMNVCIQIAQEYWLLGEAFVYGDFDLNKGTWTRFVLQNPDYMIVERTVSDEPIIMMKPDQKLKTIVTSSHPAYIEQRKQLNPEIIDAVKRGKNIVLDNFNTSFIARKISPYDVRGTGLPVCVFRQLMLFDRLRESKFVQADSMVNPTTLVKVGSAEGKLGPNDLDQIRAVFEAAENDKNFKIFTHDAVTIERIGFGQGIYDISGDITQLLKEIYIGLQVPGVLMDGGGEITYANGSVSLDVLKQRYLQFRNMLSLWLKTKVFAPISRVRRFYDYEKKGSGSVRKLVIPEIDWNHMSLFDANDYVSQLVTLSGGEDRRVSVHSLYRSLGLDFEDEQRKMKKENIASIILKKEKEALESMDLADLRKIDDNTEIIEPKGNSDGGESSSSTESGSGESSPPLPGAGAGLPGLAEPPPPLPAT